MTTPQQQQSSTQDSGASGYQELTNLPSVTLPYSEDTEAEGEAEAEIYSYPTALEPRRHGGARWFSKELRCLLYGFGDDENPYTGESGVIFRKGLRSPSLCMIACTDIGIGLVTKREMNSCSI